jgi:hypothetical protein
MTGEQDGNKCTHLTCYTCPMHKGVPAGGVFHQRACFCKTGLFIGPQNTNLRVGRRRRQLECVDGDLVIIVFFRPLLPAKQVLPVLLHAPQRLLCSRNLWVAAHSNPPAEAFCLRFGQ